MCAIRMSSLYKISRFGTGPGIVLGIRPVTQIRRRRITQFTELQIVTQDACLPRHAGIYAKLLAYRHLQNTLNDVLQQKPNPETHPHGKTLRKNSRTGMEIRHRRVTQCTDLQVVTQDACLPSHAGIWTKLLTYRHLQNTLNDVLQQKPSLETNHHVQALRKTIRLAWKSDIGVLCNVMICRLLRKIHAFPAMHEYPLNT